MRLDNKAAFDGSLRPPFVSMLLMAGMFEVGMVTVMTAVGRRVDGKLVGSTLLTAGTCAPVGRIVAIDAENPGIKLESAGRLLDTKPPLLRTLCTAAELLAGTEVNAEGTTKLRDGDRPLLSPGS